MAAMLFVHALRLHLCTDNDVPAADCELFSVYKHICQFTPRLIIDPGHCGPGNMHPLRTLFLTHPEKIQQTDHFIFIICKIHTVRCRASPGGEARDLRYRTNASALLRSCHDIPPSACAVR